VPAATKPLRPIQPRCRPRRRSSGFTPPPLGRNDTIRNCAGSAQQRRKRRLTGYRTFVKAALCLCFITGLAFTVPAIAWYRRTREKQVADRRVRFVVHHDALTSLTNRAYLIEKLDEALVALSLRSGGGLALHFLDLDHFKDVNDTLGHDAGDYLLTMVAERLRAATRPEEVTARLGSDEFVVV
jgi:predicted signal transduction protein with EAL and GGDEF domain